MKRNYATLTLVAASLAACTTYVEQPRERERVVYQEPPPQAGTYSTREPAPDYDQQSDSSDNYAPSQYDYDSSDNIRSEDDFYQPLQPYGHWEIVGSYGRCWIPARVERDWRPYCNGHWVRTDAGWYFASDEPWGWATYHYGRWAFDVRFGWVWVPGVQWAPAWVSWHEGGGYIGWAPLPPTYVVGVVYTPPPRAVICVEERHFLEPVRPTTVIVNNTTIINKTVNITKVKVVNKNTVINEGPRTTVIEQASGRKVAQEAVRDVRRRQEAPAVEKIRARKNQQRPRDQAQPQPNPADEQRGTAQDAERRARQEQQQRAAQEQRDRQEQRRAAQVEQDKAQAERRAAAQQEKDRRDAEERARQEQRRAAQLEQQKAEAERRAAAEERRTSEQRAQQEQRDRAAQEQREAERRAQHQQLQAEKEAQQRAEHERRQAAQAEQDRQQAERRAAAQQEQQQKRAEQQEPKDQKGHGKKHKAEEEGTNAVDRTQKRNDGQ